MKKILIGAIILHALLVVWMLQSGWVDIARGREWFGFFDCVLVVLNGWFLASRIGDLVEYNKRIERVVRVRK